MQAFGTPEFEISLSPASVNDCMWPTDRMWDRCSHAGMCWFITRLHSVCTQRFSSCLKLLSTAAPHGGDLKDSSLRERKIGSGSCEYTHLTKHMNPLKHANPSEGKNRGKSTVKSTSKIGAKTGQKPTSKSKKHRKTSKLQNARRPKRGQKWTSKRAPKIGTEKVVKNPPKVFQNFPTILLNLSKFKYIYIILYIPSISYTSSNLLSAAVCSGVDRCWRG
jgi:hypothetical protein